MKSSCDFEAVLHFIERIRIQQNGNIQSFMQKLLTFDPIKRFRKPRFELVMMVIKYKTTKILYPLISCNFVTPVCVCERERERESVCVCVCVRERERERERVEFCEEGEDYVADCFLTITRLNLLTQTLNCAAKLGRPILMIVCLITR